MRRSVVNNFIEKYAGVFAAFALAVVTMITNSTCVCIAYQEPLPDEAKKLRKF